MAAIVQGKLQKKEQWVMVRIVMTLQVAPVVPSAMFACILLHAVN
jgi:hypothetical protein